MTFEPALFDDNLLKSALAQGFLQYHCLNRVGGYESDDRDGFRLSHAMAAVLRLQINLRIPVTVVNDDGVGSCQIDTKTACASR